MDSQKNFQTFMRSAFGLEPGGRLGAQLEGICTSLTVPRADRADLDLSCDRVLYLASGSAKLVASASRGREQIVAFQFAGDLVSIPSGGHHRYTLTALADAALLAFPAREFFDCIAGEQESARVLIERLRTALHRCRDKAVGLGQKNAQERVASFLLAMAERIGVSDGNSCLLELPMSRRDVGDSLGLTIETVSRQITSLRETGLIATQGRSEITLLDMAGLARCSGGHEAARAQTRKLPQFDLDQGDGGDAALAMAATGGFAS